MAGKSKGDKLKADIKKLYKLKESGFYEGKEEVFQTSLAELVNRTAQFEEGQFTGAARKGFEALQKFFPTEVSALPEEYTDLDTGPTTGLDLPDKQTVDLLTGKGGANILGAMVLDEAIQGREEGVATLEDRLAGFEQDPLVQSLLATSQDLLDEELISESELDKLLGAADAQLSQIYQNQSAALSSALGGRGIDPRSGVAAELANRNRFNLLQSSAQNRIGTTLKVEQMNRAALEDAMRLGMATSGFHQGVLNMGAANIANLQAGQRLAGIGPELMSMNLAQNMDVSEPGLDWGQFGLDVGAGLLGSAGEAGFAALF